MRDWTRFAVVGDVHGEPARLARALKYLGEERLPAVFVGDYVNRGPNSRLVLELLSSHQSQHPNGVVLLRGNHEQALLNFLQGGSLSDLAAHGGLSTIQSYIPGVKAGAPDRFRSCFPEHHRRLLESTLDYFEQDDLLISHAGFSPAAPDSRLARDMWGQSHPGLFDYDGVWPRPTVICGHYVQADGRVYLSKRLICLDTGCGTIPGHPLSVLRLPERAVVTF